MSTELTKTEEIATQILCASLRVSWTDSVVRMPEEMRKNLVRWSVQTAEDLIQAAAPKS